MRWGSDALSRVAFIVKNIDTAYALTKMDKLRKTATRSGPFKILEDQYLLGCGYCKLGSVTGDIMRWIIFPQANACKHFKV